MVSGERVGDVLVEYYVNRWGVVFVRRLFSASGVTVYVRAGREVEYLRGLSGRRLQTAVKQHADDWPQGLRPAPPRIHSHGHKMGGVPRARRCQGMTASRLVTVRRDDGSFVDVPCDPPFGTTDDGFLTAFVAGVPARICRCLELVTIVRREE